MRICTPAAAGRAHPKAMAALFGSTRQVYIERLESRTLLSSTVYVDLLAPGPAHDGSTWNNAYTSLQTALGAAVAGQTIEVAQGTYYPTTTTDRTATFQLKSGVEIDGGFAGAINPTAARNVAAYPTILSGDISVAGTTSDNSYHVVTVSGAGSTAILDGVTVTAGNANGTANINGTPSYQDCGGGMLILAGSPTVRNCTFTADLTSNNLNEGDGGGGMGIFSGSSPTVSNCVFSNNTAQVRGGGLSCYLASLTINNCVFLQNQNGGGTTNSLYGGGIYIERSAGVIVDCAFDGNSSYYAGGIDLDFDLAITVTNCIFVDNSAVSSGGAVFEQGSFANPSPVFTNCTFTDNQAFREGGFFMSENLPTITNCIFWGDTGGEIGNLAIIFTSGPGTYCDIEGSTSGTGNISADPQFVRNPGPGPDGVFGTADDDFGNLQLPAYSPCVDAGNNSAVPSGVTTDLAGSSRFQDVPGSPHAGLGSIPIVDMGAYEATASLAATFHGPFVVLQGQSIALQGFGSSTLAGPLSYSWDLNGDGIFGDATGSSAVFSSSGFPAGSQVTVSLQVTDSASNTVVSSSTITVLPTTFYVDSHATGNGDGTTWANAATSLAVALNEALLGETIDVAQGTYYPTALNSRAATLQLKSGVALYGGFAGVANPGAARNPLAYPTNLSGDIGIAGNSSDNSYHVVTANGVDGTAVIDGFAILDGNANGPGTDQNDGGGMLCVSGVPVIRNCLFLGNAAINRGGGLFTATLSIGGAVLLFNPTDCVFIGNTAPTGGGISNGAYGMLLTNCTFSANTATNPFSPMTGGAIFNSSLMTLNNCILWGDSGSEYETQGNSVQPIVNCDIQGGAAGTQNINANPLFLRSPSPGPDGVWGTADDDYGNLELQAGSPCINAGNNTAIQAAGAITDVAGNPRVFNGTVDIGAYEYVADQAPAITSSNQTTFTTGTFSSFTVNTTGYPIASITETGTLPSGVTFTDNQDTTATLSGAPAASAGGIYVISLSASNGISSIATQTFTLTVADHPPAITSTNQTTFTTGTLASFTVNTNGFPIPSITETGTLPAGLSFMDNQDTTATLSGTPAANAGGIYVISLSAANGIGNAATQTFTLTVNQAPAITSGSSATFTTNAAGSFAIQSTGFPIAAIAETGLLPAGITFLDNGNGTASLSGTPGGSAGGVYILHFNANNGVGTAATQTFTLTVGRAPAITSAGSTTFTVGTAGLFAVNATGYPTPSLTETGTLPNGITFLDNGNGTATLSGTPMSGTAGVYEIAIAGSNGVLPATAQIFTLTVDAPSLITSANHVHFTSGASNVLAITTTGYPVAALTEAGSLPSGITFTNNGDGTATLTGIPAAGTAGIYALTFTAGNGLLPIATQSFTLTIDLSTWTGLGDGRNWSDPNNWSNQALPNQSDTVIIPAGVAVIQIGGGAFVAGAVNSSSPIELLSSGSLKLFGPAILDSTLAIDKGGTLDIQANVLTINYAAGADPEFTIRGYLKSAYNGGIWSGAGLTSTTVRAQVANAIAHGGGVWGIGYTDLDFNNQLLIQPALVGDADINGSVNMFDLATVAQNLGSITGDWAHGDFNYDGSVSFLDIGLVAQNLNKTTINTPLAAALPVAPMAAVVATQLTLGSLTPAAATPPTAQLVNNVRPAVTPIGTPASNLLPDAISGVWTVISASPSLLFAGIAVADLLNHN